MIYGLQTTKIILVFSIMLVLIYFPKSKRIKHTSTATKAYKLCIIAEVIHFFFQIIAIYVHKYTGQSGLFKILYAINFASMSFMLPCWIYNIRATIDDIHDMKITKMITYSKETIICAIMPLSSLSYIFVESSNKMLTDIPVGSDALYTKDGLTMICGGMVFVLFYTMSQVFKNRKKLSKEYKMIQIISFIGLGLGVILQSLMPNFAIFELGMLLVLYAYYFLQENPDIIIRKEIQLINKDTNENTKFLSNISDELKTPINNMLNICSELRLTSEHNPTFIEETLKKLNNQANLFIDMTNSVIASSQTTTDNTKVTETKYETKELVKNILDYATVKIGDKKIKLVVEVNPSISKGLYGDYTKIIDALSNIISYSIANTEIGKLKINIDSEKLNNIETLNIKIFDTGQGIKEEEQTKVFDQDNDKTRELYIAKELLELNGGELTFDSLYEAGTKFYITLPQKIMDSTSVGELNKMLEVKNIEEIDFSKYRILIVDDNEIDRNITKHYLSNYKFNIELATSGRDCIYKIKSGEKYDAIFIDIIMPDFDGIETLKVINHLGESTNTKMIAISANNTSYIKDKCASIGFDAYLEKPIRTKALENVLKQHFK